ncbi:hypothetical protein TIFTF001_003489 [Ficus carica]|uniref:Uncharacterized protein n=1 Tax=Ficus carica TaxID=3494 RepID=A0AA87ZHM4_FICCA|nr:hypothetical protein TIFTF001_003489 [Ficus carica]
MSSDLFIFDGSFYQYSSSPEVVSSEAELFFNDHEFSSPFSDSAIDILQALSDPIPQHPQNPLDQEPQISPPSQQLQSLNLHHPNLPNGFGNSHGFDAFQVKSEECQVGFQNNSSCYYNNYNNNNYNNDNSDRYQVVPFGPHSYTSGVENVTKFMQRSSSSSGFLYSSPGHAYVADSHATTSLVRLPRLLVPPEMKTKTTSG